MTTAQQLGLVGNSVRVQALPTASAETFGQGNRYYTLIGQQEGYITGHTYHTVVANDVYSWEDVAQAGPQGEDGKDYLIMIKNNVTSSVPKVGNRVYNNWSMDSFSRQVFENDKGFTVMNCTSNEKQYAVIFNCTGVTTTHVGYITYTSVSEITGATGANGKDALLYNDMIRVPDGNFIGYQYQISALFSKFNRTPQVGDFMTAIIYNEADKIVYIGTAEVTSLDGSYVNYVKINFATSITGTTVYNNLSDIPVINQDLSASGFTPVANTYYRHTGATTSTFTQGVIYCYDGTEYKALDGSGGGGISDVKVAGTSVVTDGVANIPPASESNSGVVSNIVQNNKQTHIIIGEYKSSYISPNNQSVGLSLGKNESDKDFAIYRSGQGNIIYSTYQGYPLHIYVSVGDSVDAEHIGLFGTEIRRYSNRTSFAGSKLPTYSGTLMSAPSTWSSGTSGSVTLPASGTYQLKSNLGEAIVVYDGTSQAQSAIIYADSTSLYYYDISAEGVITVSYRGKNDSTSGISTNYEIKYRKIGIA